MTFQNLKISKLPHENLAVYWTSGGVTKYTHALCLTEPMSFETPLKELGTICCDVRIDVLVDENEVKLFAHVENISTSRDWPETESSEETTYSFFNLDHVKTYLGPKDTFITKSILLLSLHKMQNICAD